jgi:hypothetical protein
MFKEFKDKENVEAIKKVYYKIFRNRDPYDEPFRDEIECIAPLLMIDTEENEMLCFLKKRQLEALSKVLNEMGEKAFYACNLEFGHDIYDVIDEKGDLFINVISYGHPGIIAGDRCFSFETVEEWEENYHGVFSLMHNAFFSTKGEWGGIISGMDPFAFIGGSRDFISCFKKHYQEWEKDFLYMKEEYDLYLKTEDDSNDVLWTKFVLPYALKRA